MCRFGVEGGLEVVMKCRDLGGEGQGVFTRSTKKSGEQKAIAYSNGWEIGHSAITSKNNAPVQDL